MYVIGIQIFSTLFRLIITFGLYCFIFYDPSRNIGGCTKGPIWNILKPKPSCDTRQNQSIFELLEIGHRWFSRRKLNYPNKVITGLTSGLTWINTTICICWPIDHWPLSGIFSSFQLLIFQYVFLFIACIYANLNFVAKVKCRMEQFFTY